MPIIRKESAQPVQRYNLDHDEELYHHLSLGHVIGQGGFGVVRCGSYRNSSDKSVAVKLVTKSKKLNSRLAEVEIDVLTTVFHPNIVRLFEVYSTPTSYYLVMELCEHGSLSTLLSQQEPLQEPDSRHIFKQLVNGLCHLHKNDIVHRDIKPDNVLLTRCDPKRNGFVVKLSDFGLACVCRHTAGFPDMQAVCGTLAYMAPEVLDNCIYSSQCDVWSSGVILYQMFCGHPPYQGTSRRVLLESIRASAKPPLDHMSWQARDSSVKSLVLDMLHQDPAFRITSGEVCHHPWVEDGAHGNSRKIPTVLDLMKQFRLETGTLVEKRPGSE